MEQEIIALALDHKLMSRYTAFVAVDRSRVTEGKDARKVAVPVEVPDAVRRVNYAAGVEGGAVGGIGYGYGAAVGGFASASYGSVGYGRIGAGSPASRSVTVSVPQIRIGQAIVVGSLDKSIIRRYIRRKLTAVRYCYEKRLKLDPKLAGTITADFTVSSDGSVTIVKVAGMGDETLEACVAAQIRSIRFPKTNSNDLVRIRYPFKLQPSQSPQ